MQSWCTHGRWDSLAEGEVGLVACCHAAPFSAASFSGVTRRWGRCRHVFVPCRHSATASCCHLVLGAVVFVTSLLHPGALFGQAQWIVFILQKRRIFLKTKQFQGYDLKIEKTAQSVMTSRVRSSHLSDTSGTKPVSLWNLGDFRPQAVHVAATIAAVAQQQALIIVSLLANLAGL